MNMILCFVIACFIATLMLVWFKSDAVIEYLWFLKRMVRDFKDMRIEVAPTPLNFPQYLRKKWDSWLTRMLSCPLCFCVCSSVLTVLVITILLLSPIVLVAIPVVVIFSLLLYGVITKLLNLS